MLGIRLRGSCLKHDISSIYSITLQVENWQIHVSGVCPKMFCTGWVSRAADDCLANYGEKIFQQEKTRCGAVNKPCFISANPSQTSRKFMFLQSSCKLQATQNYIEPFENQVQPPWNSPWRLSCSSVGLLGQKL